MTFRRAFRSLFWESDGYPGDPYGWMTNQLSHVCLGFIGTTACVYVAFHATAMWPDQVWWAGAVVVAYLLGWEMVYQKWRGWDSIADTVFVALGAAIYAAIDMSYVIERLILWIMIVAVPLAAGVLRRL